MSCSSASSNLRTRVETFSVVLPLLEKVLNTVLTEPEPTVDIVIQASSSGASSAGNMMPTANVAVVSKAEWSRIRLTRIVEGGTLESLEILPVSDSTIVLTAKQKMDLTKIEEGAVLETLSEDIRGRLFAILNEKWPSCSREFRFSQGLCSAEAAIGGSTTSTANIIRKFITATRDLFGLVYVGGIWVYAPYTYAPFRNAFQVIREARIEEAYASARDFTGDPSLTIPARRGVNRLLRLIGKLKNTDHQLKEGMAALLAQLAICMCLIFENKPDRESVLALVVLKTYVLNLCTALRQSGNIKFIYCVDDDPDLLGSLEFFKEELEYLYWLLLNKLSTDSIKDDIGALSIALSGAIDYTILPDVIRLMSLDSKLASVTLSDRERIQILNRIIQHKEFDVLQFFLADKTSLLFNLARVITGKETNFLKELSESQQAYFKEVAVLFLRVFIDIGKCCFAARDLLQMSMIATSGNVVVATFLGDRLRNVVSTVYVLSKNLLGIVKRLENIFKNEEALLFGQNSSTRIRENTLSLKHWYTTCFCGLTVGIELRRLDETVKRIVDKMNPKLVVRAIEKKYLLSVFETYKNTLSMNGDISDEELESLEENQSEMSPAATPPASTFSVTSASSSTAVTVSSSHTFFSAAGVLDQDDKPPITEEATSVELRELHNVN